MDKELFKEVLKEATKEVLAELVRDTVTALLEEPSIQQVIIEASKEKKDANVDD